VVDVHRRKAALIVMRVPERQLLAAMCRTERVVDVEDIHPARLHGRAKLIEESHTKSRRLGLARRILQAGDRRLRCQRRAGLRTATDRDLHERIVAQPVVIDGIFISAGDRRRARHHHLEHLMQDAVGIAAVRHRSSEPPTYAKLAFRLAQQQQAGVGRLGAAVEIHCEFPPAHGWQVEGKQRIVVHGGRGAAPGAPAISSGQRFAM